VLWGAARGAKLLAAGGILSAAPFLRLAAQSRIATPASEPLVSPQEIRSRDGVLQATLTAAAGPVRLGAHPFSGFLYNGAYLPPLLRVQLGDTVRVTFRNALPNKPSNLHYHGMSVSPRGNSDNVFVHVHPGETFQYEVRIPPAGRQGPGLYWYHPHAHGYVDDQILGGMSGALVVDGFERLYPLLRGLPERYLLIKHAQIDGGEVVSINGQINPLIAMRPGEMQFWRIAHIGASLFLKFRIEGMALLCRRHGWPSAVAAAQGVRVLHRPRRADRGDRGRPAAGRICHAHDFLSERSLAPAGSGARYGADRIEQPGGADGHC
jgi:FtsP/CotA-like multicopper oxidase with cupredoxin domain